MTTGVMAGHIAHWMQPSHNPKITNYQFGINITIRLKDITKSDNNGF